MALGIKELAMAVGVAACSPVAPDSPDGGNNVEDVAKVTVADIRAKMVEFCKWQPSDVDGITCVVEDDGVPVASLYEQCVSAEPSSDDSNILIEEVDAMSVPEDCEITAAQF